MRKTGKSKVEPEPADQVETNGEASSEEDTPGSPTNNQSKKPKRKSSSKSDEARKRKKPVTEGADETPEESTDKAEANGDGSDTEDIPLSKKMKRKSPKVSGSKGDNSKRKKREAELEDKVEFDVESVVGSRLHQGKRQFRIRWKGFKPEDDTWEAEEELTCPEAIQQYFDAHPDDNDGSQAKAVKGGKAKAGNKKKKPITKTKDDEGIDGEEVTKEEYEVDRVMDIFIKKTGKREFLIRWKGFGSKDDTWEPEEHLNCPDLIGKYMQKVEEAKGKGVKQLRTSRTHTERFTLSMAGSGRRLSRRGEGKQRARYHDAE